MRAIEISDSLNQVYEDNNLLQIQKWIIWKNNQIRVDSSLATLPPKLQPELKSYESSLISVGILFFAFAAVISFSALIYIILKYGYNYCIYEKNEYEIKFIRLIPPFILFGIGSLILIIGFIIGIITLVQANQNTNTAINYLNQYKSQPENFTNDVAQFLQQIKLEDYHSQIYKGQQLITRLEMINLELQNNHIQEQVNQFIKRQKKNENLVNLIFWIGISATILIIILSIYSFKFLKKSLILWLAFSSLFLSCLFFHNAANFTIMAVRTGDLCEKYQEQSLNNGFFTNNKGLYYYIPCYDKNVKDDLIDLLHEMRKQYITLFAEIKYRIDKTLPLIISKIKSADDVITQEKLGIFAEDETLLKYSQLLQKFQESIRKVDYLYKCGHVKKISQAMMKFYCKSQIQNFYQSHIGSILISVGLILCYIGNYYGEFYIKQKKNENERRAKQSQQKRHFSIV